MVLPTYSNSSFLNLFAPPNIVGFIYMLGSAITILGFLFIPFLLRKIGNYTTALWLIIIQMGLIYGIANTNNPLNIALFFILQSAVVNLIMFCIDVFLEGYSDKNHVGGIRGMYLTVQNTAWILAPFIGSIIIGIENNYRNVYMASLFMLFPLLYLVFKNFPKFKDPNYSHPSFAETLKHVMKDGNRSRLFIINIILQTFYAWMVIYSPIYLNKIIGLNWSEIGIVLTIMLLPFPIVEWPLGKLADKKYGEKEIMIIGLALLGLSTIALVTISAPSIIIWSIALFITRIGAAGAEVMIETYFFKTIDSKDSNMLGFFRVTRPLAYFIAPLITGAGFLFFKEQSYLFIVIGLLCLTAIIPCWKLKDTK